MEIQRGLSVDYVIHCTSQELDDLAEATDNAIDYQDERGYGPDLRSRLVKINHDLERGK